MIRREVDYGKGSSMMRREFGYGKRRSSCRKGKFFYEKKVPIGHANGTCIKNSHLKPLEVASSGYMIGFGVASSGFKSLW